jgi:hypothetical protein
MDVRLPNGTIIKNVPDGTTKSQLISKLKANGYDVSELEAAAKPAPEVTGEVGFLEDLRKSPAVAKLANVAERIAPSPEEVTAGIGEAIANIPESAVENILAAGGTAYDLAELAMTPSRYGEAAQKAAGAISAIPGAIYGALTSPVETIEQTAAFARKNPVGAVAVLSGVTSGAGALMPAGRKLFSAGGLEIGAPELSAISRATNPLAMPGALAQGAYRVGQEFVSPVFTQAGAERAAANKLLESVMGRPQDVTAALRTEPPSLMGGVPAAERLAAAGQYEPVLATMEADLSTALTQGGREALIARQQRLAGIQQQITAIDEQLKVQGRAMSPEAQAQLSAVRSDLLRARAAELSAIEAQQAQGAARMPATGQIAPGEALAARAGEVREAFRKERITPLYEEAFKSAGNVTIPTRQLIQTAEDILGSRLADVPVGVAARTIRDLTRLERGATLRELDRVRKSVNKDIAAAQATGKDLSDLHVLHDAIDQAVEMSRVPTRAKIEYANALNTYRTEFVPRFRTGVAADILRTTKKNQRGILPSGTVAKFLANEDNAAQFAATFGNDAVARTAIESGIQDLARLEAIDPTTYAVRPEALDKFLFSNARKFELMGVDGETILGPIREEARMLERGYAELSKELAFAEGVKTPQALVDILLKDPAAMDATRRRLTDTGRSALTKEIVDRGIRLLNDRKPEEVLNYLDKNKSSIRMVLDQPYFDRLKDLAENQRALMEVEKRAQRPSPSNLTVDLSKVPQDRLTDLRLLANEVQRIEDAEKMMKLRPSEDVTKAGAPEIETARRGLRGLLDRRATVMEKVMGVLSDFANRKTAAVLTDALTRDPAKAADLIERAILRQNKPASPPETRARGLRRVGVTGALAAPNMMAPENQNAMARR